MTEGKSNLSYSLNIYIFESTHVDLFLTGLRPECHNFMYIHFSNIQYVNCVEKIEKNKMQLSSHYRILPL